MVFKTKEKRKTTSLKIDERIWKIARHKAIDKNIDASDYIESLIINDNKKQLEKIPS